MVQGFQTTPGYQAAQQRSQERHDTDIYSQDFEALPGYTGSGETWVEAIQQAGVETLLNMGAMNRNLQLLPGVGRKIETMEDYGADILDFVFSTPLRTLVTEEIPGLGQSAGEIVGAVIDTAANDPKSLLHLANPFLPFFTPEQQQGVVAPLTETLTESKQVRASIYSMAPNRTDPERLALLNVLSGPQKTEAAATAINNQTADVEALQQQAYNTFMAANDPSTDLPEDVRATCNMMRPTSSNRLWNCRVKRRLTWLKNIKSGGGNWAVKHCSILGT